MIAKTINSDDLSDFLADLVCGDDPAGYITKAITKRALLSYFNVSAYNGSLDKFSRVVSHENCAGAKSLDEEMKIMLCESVSWSEDEIEKTFCAL